MLTAQWIDWYDICVSIDSSGYQENKNACLATWCSAEEFLSTVHLRISISEIWILIC